MADLFDDTAIDASIRSMIGEASAKFWSSADITNFKNMAMIKLTTELGYMMYPLKKKTTTATMTSGANTVSLPTDCYRIGKVEVWDNGDGTWQQLRWLQEDEIYRFSTWSTGDPVAWTFSGGSIMIFPTPNRTVANFFRIWYMEHLNSVADFPEEVRPLIAVEAAMLAKMKDDDVPAWLFEIQKQYRDAAIASLTMVQWQEPEMMRDYELEEIYTSRVEE